MEIELSLENAAEAAIYLRAMATAIEVAGATDDSDVRRLNLASYLDNQEKLRNLIPLSKG